MGLEGPHPHLTLPFVFENTVFLQICGVLWLFFGWCLGLAFCSCSVMSLSLCFFVLLKIVVAWSTLVPE